MKQKSNEHWQAEFYASQPVEYRMQWWWWARTQPNFLALYKACKEHDEQVLRIRDSVYGDVTGQSQHAKDTDS